MLLLILCLPFRGNEEEVRWVWTGITWIPQTLIIISLMCIGVYLYSIKRGAKENRQPTITEK